MCLLKKEYTFCTLLLHIGLNGRKEACELGRDLRSGVEEASIDFGKLVGTTVVY